MAVSFHGALQWEYGAAGSWADASLLFQPLRTWTTEMPKAPLRPRTWATAGGVGAQLQPLAKSSRALLEDICGVQE